MESRLKKSLVVTESPSSYHPSGGYNATKVELTKANGSSRPERHKDRVLYCQTRPACENS